MKGRALILGGRTGLLGQALVRTLHAREWETFTLGREDGDLLDPAVLDSAVEKAHPNVIFNSMGWTQVDAAEDEPAAAMQWNRALPASLARLVKGTDMFLVHYSTDFVFGGQPPQNMRAYTEQDETQPRSVYGVSKLAGETLVLENAPDNACVLRTAWLFGPGRKNFITTILDACRKRDAINVVHDQIGSPTYTMDLALWSALLAEKRATGLFNAVNGGRASWCELACEAVALAEAPCRVSPISSSKWPQKAERPTFSVLDTAHLAATIGITPRPWPRALREYIFKEYPVKGHPA